MPEPTNSPSGSPKIPFSYISNVTDKQFAEASATLDRALLSTIGLPEFTDIRDFENTVYVMTNKLGSLISNFSLSRLIVLLPELITDALALWEKVEPHLIEPMERKDFVSKVITYVYRKADPDILFLVEPFESMVENMILGAVPGLIDNIEGQLQSLMDKIAKLFG